MSAPPLLAVLNGPDMTLLGLRQPELCGHATLAKAAAALAIHAVADLLPGQPKDAR